MKRFFILQFHAFHSVRPPLDSEIIFPLNLRKRTCYDTHSLVSQLNSSRVKFLVNIMYNTKSIVNLMPES